MPVYEYHCNTCNHQFELRQKFSDAPAGICPKCDGDVHKMVSAAAFSLKGGGWYGDGYGAKTEAAPKSEADTAAGTETAPETAPKEAGTTEATPKETTASPAAPATPAASQPETKSPVAEKPAAPSTEKAKTE